MAHVVTSACFGCKYTDCVVECPVDAFREGEQMLYIDPETCICCDQCVRACPVGAIYAEDDVPADQREFIGLNKEMSLTCPPIYERREPLVGRHLD